ncbi:MAG TPA: putative DNA modification/repair radical SAM protein [Polyangiaceae bacterium]|nr:putative DNA modification/repair radical SAM protein [Polyangiaceae bacterium]
MDLKRKLTVLADAAKYDASCASSGSRRAAAAGGLGSTNGTGICHSYTPDGRCVSLLKVLLTNYCVYDCQYCVNRSSSDVERARFTPEEVVQLTLDFYRRNYIEGLFLSSGVLKNADYTMELLVQVARQLRQEHRFGGYIHLKAAPGVDRRLLDEAGRYADRVSVNVELPTRSDLARLAPEKNMEGVESVMAGLRDGVLENQDAGAKQTFLPAGQSTQMIVGATETSDGQILSTASALYRGFGLRRVYYSAFSPIPHADPRLPPAAPPLLREHRLYEADWLMRQYGFSNAELIGPHENLRLDIDPKLAWALRHRELFPVDVNRAERDLLLRVPGLGARTVQRLLALRRQRGVRLDDLRRLRANVRHAAHFIITADVRPTPRRLEGEDLERALRPAEQLQLFPTSPALPRRAQ